MLMRLQIFGFLAVMMAAAIVSGPRASDGTQISGAVASTCNAPGVADVACPDKPNQSCSSTYTECKASQPGSNTTYCVNKDSNSSCVGSTRCYSTKNATNKTICAAEPKDEKPPSSEP